MTDGRNFAPGPGATGPGATGPGATVPGATVPGEPLGLSAAAQSPSGGAPLAAPGKRPRRWPFVVAGILVVLLAAIAVAWGPVTREITVRQARAHGVILLEIGDVELGWGEVTVRDFAFELEDVKGLTGTAKKLTVELDGLQAASLDGDELELKLVGSAAVLAVAISEWTGSHPELVRIPSKAEDVSLSWRESAGGPVWLKFRGGTIEPLKNGAKLAAERTSVFGLPIGGVGAVWKGDEATAKLGFGRSDEDEAPISIEVEDLRSKPKATIELRPTPLLKLSGPLGMLLPIQGVTVSGDAVLRYKGERKAPILGHVNAKLAGYAPPLPRQAQGFVFGDTTTLSTDVEFSADRKKVSLQKLKVKHGGFELTGGGSITRGKSYAAIELNLSGNIQCVALAKAALAGGMGGRLGPLAARLASGAVKGSVRVKLAIEADSRNLLSTKIESSLGVGCGIQWPDLPTLPDGLPSIPGLPTFPGFP